MGRTRATNSFLFHIALPTSPMPTHLGSPAAESRVENVIGGAGAARSSRHRLPQHEAQRRLGPEQGAQHVGPNHLNHLFRRDVDEQPLGGDLSCRAPVDGAAGGGVAASAAGSLSRWGGDAGSETCAPCHRPPTTMQRSQPPVPPALLIHKSTPPSRRCTNAAKSWDQTGDERGS